MEQAADRPGRQAAAAFQMGNLRLADSEIAGQVRLRQAQRLPQLAYFVRFHADIVQRTVTLVNTIKQGTLTVAMGREP